MKEEIKKIFSMAIFFSITFLLLMIVFISLPALAVNIVDGDLIRNPNALGEAQLDVYIAKIVGGKKFKRLILSPHVFESYGHLSWDDIKLVDQVTINEYKTSDLVRCSDLEKGIDDPKVYQLIPQGDTGTKTWLNLTPDQFEAQGYDWASIYIINQIDRDAYNVGEEIKEAEVPVKIYNQNISGEIKQDQIWSGIIHVTGDVRVKEGVTLTILPGTKVIVTAHQDDQHGGEVDPGLEAESPEAIAITLKAGYPPKDDEYVKSHVTIEIKGTLNAIGTQENRIIFTSDNASPTTYDWYRLRIWDGNLEYAVVEYARMITIEGGSQALNKNVKISNNIIRHMLEGAISIGFLDKTASPIISNNEIYDCGNECIHLTSGSAIITNNILRPGRERMLPGYGGTGIVIWDMFWDWLGVDKMGNPTIENNLIEEANWNGIAYRSATSSPIIRYNIIRNCTTGINFERSGTGSPVIFYNNIYNNEDNNINDMVNQTFNLSNNWWGTTDTSEIDAKIWDYADDPNLGKINYNPILNAPIEE